VEFLKIIGEAEAVQDPFVLSIAAPHNSTTRRVQQQEIWDQTICHPAYAFTKRALQAATLRAIDDARRLDLDLLASRMTDPGGLRAHARRYRELKGRDPTWEISSQATE
jgi:hypothetical protein